MTPKPVSQLPQPTDPPAIVKASASVVDGTSIQISFASIQPGIPPDLFRKANPAGLDRHRFPLPLSEALAQIQTGTVKVTLSQLRDSAPPGLFIDPGEKDGTEIPLPLKDIIGHLPKDAFAKRPNQKVVEAPENIAPLFGTKEAPSKNIRLLGKDEISPLSPLPGMAPQDLATPEPAPSPEPKIKPDPVPAGNTSHSTRSAPTARITAPPTLSSAPIQTANLPETTPLPSDPKVERLRVPLSELLTDWPESIRLEAGYQHLTDSICALPLPQVKEGLRSGRVRYHWKSIRSWLEPNPPTTPSTHGELILELSLKSLSNRIISTLSGSAASPAPSAPKTPAPAKSTEETKIPASKALADLAAAASAAPPAPKAAKPADPSRINASAGSKPAQETAKPAPLPRSEPPPAEKSRPSALPTQENAGGIITVDLESVCRTWPQEIRQELADIDVAQAKLELPLTTVENALKLGKVSYPWKDVSSWINPPSEASLASPHAETEVTLPLNIIAPLYLANRPAQTPRKKVEADLTIPDVFDNAKTSPAKKAAPTPTPTPAPAPAPKAATPPPKASEPGTADSADPGTFVETRRRKLATSLPELFGEPNKRNWTPNEIVQHTTHLPEVNGALIALQDGLLVASAMPPPWRTDTIAAFIPQIFGRMRQYSGELSMGDLTSISFTVDQGTFQVFNAGIIYFAVLGAPQACLPIPELNLIALELSRHTK